MSLTNSPIWFGSGATGSGFYNYEINDSLRFNANDSAYLNRTPSTAGNAKTFTISFWLKRSRTDTAEYLFAGGNDVNDRFHMNTNASGTFQIEAKNGGSQVLKMEGGPVLRDVSAWYHFVLRVDTTQATASDRVRLYKNGELVTFNSNSYPSQNTNLNWNINDQLRIGRSGWDTNYFSGYMAEFINVDGQSLGPDSFGETKSGVWIPKSYGGSYGTNGFYLNFSNNSTATNLGLDSSGNSNNWSVNNIATTDQMPDSPTNNFCTLTVLNKLAQMVGEQGSLKVGWSTSGNIHGTFGSTYALNSGKWYWEVRVNTSRTDSETVGIMQNGISLLDKGQMAYGQSAVPSYAWAIHEATKYKNAASGGSYGTAANSASDIIGVALDLSSNPGSITMYKNGVSIGAMYSDIDTDYKWTPAVSGYGGGTQTGFIMNFGQDSTFAGATAAGGNADANGYGDFQYAPPSDFLSLCSANLPEVAIDPANDETPEDYFNTLLYTGNGANGRALTGVGFQPDWTWIKSRSASRDHKITDSVRGVNKEIGTQSFGVEVTRTNGLSAFGSDGFTVGSESGYNNSGDTFVAWNWKAGGTAVSNTDGDITSQVSANVESGFSIVTYSGNSTGSQTVGHGLSKALDCVIAKARTGGNGNWPFSHTGYADTSLLTVDTTQALSTGAGTRLQRTTSTSTFLVGDSADYSITNASGWTYVAYCFHGVEGYSKFGSYVGNGSTDGPLVYTGFRPAWIMIRRTDAGNNWHLADNKRQNTFNPVTAQMYPNLNNAEAAQNDLDFVSNGFKLRNSASFENASGGTYIYMAFAEQPFKYANAR